MRFVRDSGRIKSQYVPENSLLTEPTILPSWDSSTVAFPMARRSGSVMTPEMDKGLPKVLPSGSSPGWERARTSRPSNPWGEDSHHKLESAIADGINLAGD